MATNHRDSGTDVPCWHIPKDNTFVVNISKSDTRIFSNTSVWIVIASIKNQKFRLGWKKTTPHGTLEGNILLSEDQLKAAFGVCNQEEMGQMKNLDRCTTMMSEYAADICCTGRFLRYTNFLNIPAPSTRFANDPNISILITDEIREAVRTLVERK